jgi:hypothetical protein
MTHPLPRCSMPLCPHPVDRAAGGARAVLAGREVFLCAMHRVQAQGALVGAAKGLASAFRQKFPGLAVAMDAAQKFHRASQLEPEPPEAAEPIFVEAKVVR